MKLTVTRRDTEYETSTSEHISLNVVDLHDAVMSTLRYADRYDSTTALCNFDSVTFDDTTDVVNVEQRDAAQLVIAMLYSASMLIARADTIFHDHFDCR